MKHKIITLSNGLKTLFIHSPGCSAATIQMWFQAGSTYETSTNSGIAHFLEHMFFKGTQKRPAQKLAFDTESYGGGINAFTSFDYTCYYINSPNSKIKNSVDILLDMVSNPLFKQEELVPERGVVFEEYLRSQDNPGQSFFHEVQNNFFNKNYQKAILGNPETIMKFTQKQLRDFRNKHYNQANAFFIVAGDLSSEFPTNQLIKQIESFSIPKGKKETKPSFELIKKTKFFIHKKDIKSSSFSLMINSPEIDHKNAAIEDVALSALGYGESSPLYRDLVISSSLARKL